MCTSFYVYSLPFRLQSVAVLWITSRMQSKVVCTWHEDPSWAMFAERRMADRADLFCTSNHVKTNASVGRPAARYRRTIWGSRQWVYEGDTSQEKVVGSGWGLCLVMDAYKLICKFLFSSFDCWRFTICNFPIMSERNTIWEIKSVWLRRLGHAERMEEDRAAESDGPSETSMDGRSHQRPEGTE